MKKVLFVCLAFLAFGITSMTIYNTDSAEGMMQTYVKIKIENKCSDDVKYEYNGLHGSLSGNYKRELTIKPGHDLKIDGKVVAEITTASDKKTYIVCD